MNVPQRQMVLEYLLPEVLWERNFTLAKGFATLLNIFTEGKVVNENLLPPDSKKSRKPGYGDWSVTDFLSPRSKPHWAKMGKLAFIEPLKYDKSVLEGVYRAMSLGLISGPNLDLVMPVWPNLLAALEITDE